MTDATKNLTEGLLDKINAFTREYQAVEVGTVIEIGDGIGSLVGVQFQADVASIGLDRHYFHRVVSAVELANYQLGPPPRRWQGFACLGRGDANSVVKTNCAPLRQMAEFALTPQTESTILRYS